MFLGFAPAVSLAQKKFSPVGGVQAGLLEGEQGGALQLKALGGVKKGTWTAAAGAGLDYYYLRSIPVFLHLQKDFSKSKAPFVYAAGGYNIPWLKPSQKGWNLGESTGGFYGDAGIGYRLPVMKSSALEFSLGYSVKSLTTSRYKDVYITIYPPPPMVLYKQEHTLRRVSIKTGLWF